MGYFGSVAPLVHAMLLAGGIGYAMHYPHVQAEYQANPPTWSKWYTPEKAAAAAAAAKKH